jgi:hypothetical protein
MTRKMPREAFATEIAPNNGWIVVANMFPARPDGVVVDTYYRDGGENDMTPDVMIGWAPNHCAAFVYLGPERVTGALALIEARKYIEAHSYTAV